MTKEEIQQYLPYEEPFLFVDELESVSEDRVIGHYNFKQTEGFYRGHFKGNPVTPGVILTEVMAQIGLVCMGISLLGRSNQLGDDIQIGMSSASVDFFLPVFPGDRVTVISEKEYFRFNKLKCKVRMIRAEDELICRGTIAGMIK